MTKSRSKSPKLPAEQKRGPRKDALYRHPPRVYERRRVSDEDKDVRGVAEAVIPRRQPGPGVVRWSRKIAQFARPRNRSRRRLRPGGDMGRVSFVIGIVRFSKHVFQWCSLGRSRWQTGCSGGRRVSAKVRD